jgi:potassium efflux system protein
VTALLLWVTIPAFDQFGLRNEILRVAASLLNAWIIVRLITSNIRDGMVANTLALLAWLIAALYILRLLQPVTQSLDSTIIEFGGVKFSILRLLTSLAVAAFALWLGRIAGDAAQAQLRSSKKLTPSMAGLLGQVLKIAFIIIAILIALQVVGVNLTALTILSGTLGIGIGFGLQAIFSNFVSGVIILIEKSVKVGDFIELQSGVTGLVREINIRSTLVTTNDNVDILVPNEEFIKAQVINWTLREARRRAHVPFGVAYGSDKELVRKAGLEAADEVEWTLKGMPGRQPQVWLTKFGDSALEFELVVWLTDAAVARPARVVADYNWALHTALEKYELEIPFPQRDLHLKSATGLNVTVETRKAKFDSERTSPLRRAASPA